MSTAKKTLRVICRDDKCAKFKFDATLDDFGDDANYEAVRQRVNSQFNMRPILVGLDGAPSAAPQPQEVA